MSDDAMVVGIMSPGAMGAQVGACLVAAGVAAEVLHAGTGRSAETLARAEAAGLVNAGEVPAMIEAADMIVSICPPSAALELSQTVADAGFEGVYVDANAVSSETARLIAQTQARFVDGGIVGPPPLQPGSTRLYLSSDQSSDAGAASALFEGSSLEVRIVEGGAGAASALKMCFAAWTKGSAALLFAIRALAEAEGVGDALMGEWAASMPGLEERSERSAGGVGPKAWRFEGEMEQIAASFEAQGLPGGFHQAAAEIYQRLASLKGRTDANDPATLDEVIAMLNR